VRAAVALRADGPNARVWEPGAQVGEHRKLGGKARRLGILHSTARSSSTQHTSRGA
jgi:hypothetical protein